VNFDAIVDIDSPIILFPVRHHSPTAARLVRELIETRRPKAVLIEGPSDFNDRFDELYLPHRLPIATYSYVRYPALGRRGAYHPFCEHSPEWQALLAARVCGADAFFIDLPFYALARAVDEPTNRYADAEMQGSRYTALLCRKLGVEDFNAVWDTLFEVDLALSVETYLQRCHSLCGNMRLLEGAGSLSDRRREAFMAARIREARQKYEGQIVVVTGGFHSLALHARLAACGLAVATAKPQAADALCDPADFSPPAPEPGEERGIALTPYSFERLDSLTGYNAGMPNPGFYQQLWRDQRTRRDTHRTLLKDVAARLRERNQRVSAADLIAVEATARGLAALRGHPQVWRTDLVDALTASLIKEELSKSGSHPILDAVYEVLRGGERGLLAAGTVLPPLVHDIRKELAEHDLEPRPTPREIHLELEEAGHRLRSRVLHRLRTLQTGGHERTGGTDMAAHDDVGRVWEEWRIVWHPDFDAHCIEAARYGPTLADAAASRLTELAALIERDAARAALLLLDAALAGLTDIADSLLARLCELIRGDGDFFSVSAALGHLLYLYRYDAVLETAGRGEIGGLLVETFERGLWLFESLGQVTGRDADLLRGVQSLRETFERCGGQLVLNREAFLDVLHRVGVERHNSPLVRGAALGARWSLGAADGEQVQAVLRLFADPNHLGDFLTGLFALAREQVQRQRDLVLSIHSLLGCYSDDDFLVALPALRLAFTYFTPREKHHLALTLREGLGLTKEPELAALTVNVETAARALAFETRLFEALDKYGVRGLEP
jgi:hypothetical protein